MAEMTEYARQDVELRLRVSIPSAGTFVLNTSLLNGSDVLGSSYDWVDYQDEIVEINHTRNKDVTSGIFIRPIANTASIVLRAPELDPNLNPYIHPNTRVMLDWKPVVSGTWTNCLTGYIKEVDSTYNYNGGSIISIEAEDMMTRFLNAPIASFTAPSQPLWITWDTFAPLAIAAAGLDDGVYDPNDLGSITGMKAVNGALSYENTTVGRIVNDLVDMELGQVYFGTISGNVYLFFDQRDYPGYDTFNGYTTNFDSFTSGYSSDYLFSTIQASLTSAPATVYTRTNTDVANFYGDITQTAQLNLATTVDLDQWMASILQHSPGVRIKEFSTPYFVLPRMRDYVYIVNDFIGQTEGILQAIVSSTIYVTPTSVSTQMQLFQPV
jgi:hypothetical protein